MRLRQLRIEKGLTLEEVGKEINVSNQTISNWEKGKTQPDIQSLIHLADLFHVTIDYLVEREDDIQNLSALKFQISKLSLKELQDITVEYICALNKK